MKVEYLPPNIKSKIRKLTVTIYTQHRAVVLASSEFKKNKKISKVVFISKDHDCLTYVKNLMDFFYQERH